MKLIFSHPTGVANVRAAAQGFQETEILSFFYTTVASFPGNIFDRLSFLPGLSEFKRRGFDPALMAFVKTEPWLELARQISLKTGLKALTKHETGVFSIDAVYRNLDQHVADFLRRSKGSNLDAIYGYEDGSVISFQEAKKLGLKCLFDLPIGYWRGYQNVLLTESERWPDWKATLTGLNDSPAKLLRKDQELLLADKIFVASKFTADTLKDFPGTLSPIKIIPYGFPPIFQEREFKKKAISKVLKIIFVGGLSQRKGIADLFAATSYFKDHIELTVVGLKVGEPCRALDEALLKHRWIPSLPHHQILELMRQNDVLVFPSLFEGFGLVITEAMSQGTPVITTECTAGPDLIEHDRDGWIIKAGSTEALKEAFEKILNYPDLTNFGKEAMETARQRPWEVYKQELSREVLSENW
jgi:glycosyltransferase involved in cell wall biosynthesis